MESKTLAQLLEEDSLKTDVIEAYLNWDKMVDRSVHVMWDKLNNLREENDRLRNANIRLEAHIENLEDELEEFRMKGPK